MTDLDLILEQQVADIRKLVTYELGDEAMPALLIRYAGAAMLLQPVAPFEEGGAAMLLMRIFAAGKQIEGLIEFELTPATEHM